MKVLVYGYGNPGRRDDGLGPALVQMVEKWIESEKIDHVSVDSNYQLNIEDAYEIRDYDTVIFADATVEDIKDFKLSRVEPSDKTTFTMHAVSPSFILDLSQKINDHSPDVFLLHIKGYEFQLEEGLTERAEKNLILAFRYLNERLSRADGVFDPVNS